MPELPEVEHLRRTLEPAILGVRIASVVIARRDVVHGLPKRDAAAALLAGDRPRELVRHGKHMAVIGSSGRAVCIHLGMSGTVRVLDGPVPLPDHAHVVWTLQTGQRLVFRDPRRFGGIWIASSLDELRTGRWSDLGPDALAIESKGLRDRLAGSSRAIKAALLDQRVLAGVGNIYADEALFLARVHPARPAPTLTNDELARLAGAIVRVLRESIEAGGSTLRDYVDAQGRSGGQQRQHRVYGRSGQPCPVCGRALERLVIAQRGTSACPSCQK